MAKTVRLLWQKPNKDSDPWFEAFDGLLTAQDQTVYANREDRNIVLGNGGIVSWDSGTGTLTWDNAFELYSTIAGFRLDIDADSIVLQEGEVFYVDLTRFPTTNGTLIPQKAFTIPNTNDAMVIAIRRGDDVYFRTGDKLENGDARDLFAGPGVGANTDIYERMATFGVPIGSSSDTATVGRINFNGSLVGLSVEITKPVTAGTVVVNVKIGGVTKLTATLDTGTTTSFQLTASPGTHPIVTNDAITVEYIATGYDNGPSVPAGLTANVTLASGVALPLGGIPDASFAQKGITKLSVDPVLANEPIACGDNDPRLAENRRLIYTIVGGDGADFTIPISPAMSTINYIVLHTLATTTTQVTVNSPTADRLTTSFRVLTSAPLTIGDTIYFNVVAL